MTKENNKVLIIVVVVAAILLFLGAFGYRGYGMMGGYSLGVMSFGWIFNILIIILIIVGIYWLIKKLNRNERRK